jgi:hypothetical protein
MKILNENGKPRLICQRVLEKYEEILINLPNGYAVTVGDNYVIPHKAGFFNENGYKLKGKRYNVELEHFHIFD